MRRLIRAIVAVACLQGAGAAAQPPDPVVTGALAAAGRYVAEYERLWSSLVAEEDYTQRLGTSKHALSRRLRSDVLLVFDADFGFLGFRDVFEVDGRAVRGREQRLVNLFLKPQRDPLARARQIADESSRYNLNYDTVQLRRTINMPLMALKFLRAGNQPRSTFHVDPRARAEANDIVLTFTERARPRLIESPDELPARGAFHVDPASGRISRSELSIRTGGTRIVIRVHHALNPRLNAWLPASMEEEYRIGMIGHVLGDATYSNYRQFLVETSTEIDRE